MEDALAILFYFGIMCAGAWLNQRIYNDGVRKGVALTLNNFSKMHHSFEVMVVDGNGTVEFSFSKVKEKAKADAG